MKKLILTCMAVILTFVAGVGTPLKVYAAPDDTMLAESQALYSFTNQNGEELIFPTFEDYDIYLKAHTDKQLRYGENWVLQEVLASSTKQQMFVNYHPGTPNWALASSYTIAAGKTYSVGGMYTFENVNLDIGFSYSYSVATTIPADASRYSRLGVYADYTFKQERYAEYLQGQPTGNTRISTYAIRNANYIKPIYK